MAEDVFAVVETSLSRFGLAPFTAARAEGLRPVLVSAAPHRYEFLDGAPEVDQVRSADTTDPVAVARALADLPVRGVYSLTDYSVHVAAQVARDLGLPGLSPAAAATA